MLSNVTRTRVLATNPGDPLSCGSPVRRGAVRRFAPENAGEAHRQLEAGGTRGRLVIVY